jgi:hypothetical protein
MVNLSNDRSVIPDKQNFIEKLSRERDNLIILLDETLKKEISLENDFPKEQLQQNRDYID